MPRAALQIGAGRPYPHGAQPWAKLLGYWRAMLKGGFSLPNRAARVWAARTQRTKFAEFSAIFAECRPPGGKADISQWPTNRRRSAFARRASPRSFLEIKVENVRSLFCARSLDRFFQRAFPLLRLRILSGFQCRVRYAKFTMLQTSEPHTVKGVALNFLCLRFANWTRHHRQFPSNRAGPPSPTSLLSSEF